VQSEKPAAKYFSNLFWYPDKMPSDYLGTILEGQENLADWVGVCTGKNPKTGNYARERFRPEHAVLVLSETIARQRLALHTKSDDAYRFWQITSIISIVLGMLTTIIVSLSTTVFGRAEGTLSLILRVLAIVFPALGTAVAALIGGVKQLRAPATSEFDGSREAQRL
jgi:hypothetical protein